MNFRAVSEQTKTHYDSLLTEGITCKPYLGIRRGISAGGAILRPNRSVVEKRDVIEIVEITPSRQTVIIQDPARHERIQRTHLENRRALQRQCFVGQDHFARYRQPFETLQKALIELRRLHDYAQVVEIKTTAALEPFSRASSKER